METCVVRKEEERQFKEASQGYALEFIFGSA